MSATPPSSEPQSPPPQPSAPAIPSPAAVAAGRATTTVTNLLRLTGGAIAANELLLHYATLRPIALAVAALCIAGGNVSETVLLKIIERFFGGPTK